MSDQPCGHPTACIVSHGETHHCGWCEEVAGLNALISRLGDAIADKAEQLREHTIARQTLTVDLITAREALDGERRSVEIATAALGEARAKADRLARILAVERGDASAAPSGWERYQTPAGDYGWRRGAETVVRCDDDSPTLWSWSPDGSVYRASICGETALEAIEAADAARGE